MSEVDDMLRRYKEVRQRLRYPPNAVPDTGINLKRSHSETISPPPAVPQPEAPQIKPPPLPPIQEAPTKGLTFSSTLSLVADEFGLTMDEIRARTFVRRHSLPRHIAIYLASRQHKWTMTQLGHYLRRDHTTIIYARDRIASMIERDLDFRDRIKMLEDKLAALTLSSPSVPYLHQPPLAEGPEGGLPEPGISGMD